MNGNRDCAGIDWFRLIAAFLVVSVHTLPRMSVLETGGFILTSVLVRVAVPFFFMTSGYFSITRYAENADALKRLVKKTLLLYGAAILLYLPVNVYNGSFSGGGLPGKILRDLVFNGTLYHLWYLPAAALGGAIAWYAVRRLGYKGALVLTSFLYLIGLFGDSYYGISEAVPFLRAFYGLLFRFMDYTRNGLFLAPLFFVLGAFTADRRRTPALLRDALGFLGCFALMLGEAVTVHLLGLPRHDSMYLFLPLCMVFLFRLLLGFPGKRIRLFRTASMLIYLLHPAVILGVRLLARLLHAEALLVFNGPVHFLTVWLLSAGIGFAGAAGWSFLCRFRKKTADPATERAWIEVDPDSLAHNVKVLQDIMPPGCRLMAVVKANAYGHGAFPVSSYLERIGVRSFAVATADEGIALRRAGIEGEILILGYTDVRRARELRKYRLMQTVISHAYACALNGQGVPVRVHVKVDTGMHRLGVPFSDYGAVAKIFGMKNLAVCGMYTHLCCADSRKAEDIAFTEEQIRRFYGLAERIAQNGLPVPKLHVQSSYGLLNDPALVCDYVRVGIALYGVLSRPAEQTVASPALRPVLALKARIVHIQTVREGEGVGYGRAFTAARDSRIAVLPIGYGDGFPRSLSCGKGCVRIGDKIAPIVGRICMDQLAVDVTEIEEAAVGVPAVLIGTDGEEALSAPFVAERAGSIANELLCRLGPRLPVVIRKGQDR